MAKPKTTHAERFALRWMCRMEIEHVCFSRGCIIHGHFVFHDLCKSSSSIFQRCSVSQQRRCSKNVGSLFKVHAKIFLDQRMG